MNYYNHLLGTTEHVSDPLEEMVREFEEMQNLALKQLTLAERTLLEVESRLIGSPYSQSSKSSTAGPNQNDLENRERH